MALTSSCSTSQTDKTKVILTFIGAPGSGKGTLAAQCVSKLSMKMLSTGDLCRQAIGRGDDFSAQLKSYIDAGQLIPDELITQMVQEWLEKNTQDEKTIILDGFPRTTKQAELLLELLKNNYPKLTLHGIEFEISDETIVKRISNRLICGNKKCQKVYSRSMFGDEEKFTCSKCGSEVIRRSDDEPDAVQRRLNVHAKHSSQLLDYYKAQKTPLHNLSVENKSIDKVFEDFKNLYATLTK